LLEEMPRNFEFRLGYFAIMALQQALEELHYNDSLYGRPQATVTHQPGAVSHKK
jgi:hypothetical protein